MSLDADWQSVLIQKLAMKTSLSSVCICSLILILLPLTLSSSPAADSLREREQRLSLANRTEQILLPQLCKGPQCVTQIGHVVVVERKVQLYSRTSRRFIQIKKTEVDAHGEKGSQYARLVLESVGVRRVMIRGDETNRYLCLSKKGDLVTMEKGRQFSSVPQCQFSETLNDTGYHEYSSIQYPQWFVGFSRKGRPRNGRKSCKKCRHFLSYYIS